MGCLTVTVVVSLLGACIPSCVGSGEYRTAHRTLAYDDLADLKNEPWYTHRPNIPVRDRLGWIKNKRRNSSAILTGVSTLPSIDFSELEDTWLKNTPKIPTLDHPSTYESSDYYTSSSSGGYSYVYYSIPVPIGLIFCVCCYVGRKNTAANRTALTRRPPGRTRPGTGQVSRPQSSRNGGNAGGSTPRRSPANPIPQSHVPSRREGTTSGPPMIYDVSRPNAAGFPPAGSSATSIPRPHAPSRRQGTASGPPKVSAVSPTNADGFPSLESPANPIPLPHAPLRHEETTSPLPVAPTGPEMTSPRSPLPAYESVASGLPSTPPPAYDSCFAHGTGQWNPSFVPDSNPPGGENKAEPHSGDTATPGESRSTAPRSDRELV